ncbi:coiled-coil domain-containing protein 174-like isoform X2 [Mytilus californianus]|uniref:coiled-coil domain-containing protein 174-like isoform X2 n=1 Tax=Mytilus californianus TaxID=6549 RepID=UPI002246D307|nr:coiled-coil domain-containing protein 174-like isoform X2 [Mytilus californianus]
METQKKTRSSSIIDLKAELFRKQEEFKQQKLQSSSTNYVKSRQTEKKSTVWSKQNVGVLQRAQKDLESKAEEENEYEKSRKALEKKSKLYEQISKASGIPEEDGSKVFLVDFQKKVIDNILEERNKQRDEEEKGMLEDNHISDADIHHPKDKGEEWVDYTDSLGRSRRCMKKDLSILKERDKDLQGKQDRIEEKNSALPTLMSDDMRRELLRQKWEKEELEAMNGPIHYSNVRFDEKRSHGVGFFEFDKSEAGRQEQLDTLNQLRKQTQDERSKKEKLKEKRKAMLDARLAKVKQRKLIREGGSLVPDVLLKDDEDADIGPKLEEMVPAPKLEEMVPVGPIKPELLTRDESLRHNQSTREWDKGKEKLFPPTSEEKYFEDRRKERNQNFAPPMSLYADDKKKSGFQNKKQSVHSGQTTETSKFVILRRDPSTSNKRKDGNNPDTSLGIDNLSSIPLPSDVKAVGSHDSVNDVMNYNVPLFDVSVPPPNIATLQNNQQNYSRPNYQNPEFPFQTPSNVNYQTPVPTEQSPAYVGDDVSNVTKYYTQQFSNSGNQQVTDIFSQHLDNLNNYSSDQVNLTSSVGYSNELANLQATSFTPVSQPPKPKLNIIDPRYIQNKDVLSQNPGNLSIQQDSKSCLEKSNDTDSQASLEQESNSYSGNPVAYE